MRPVNNLWKKFCKSLMVFQNLIYFKCCVFFFLRVGLRFNYINLCGYLLCLGIFANFVYFFFSKNTLLRECKTSIHNIQHLPVHFLRKYVLYFLCLRWMSALIFFYTQNGYLTWQLCIFFFCAWKFSLANIINNNPIILIVGLFAILIFLSNLLSPSS